MEQIDSIINSNNLYSISESLSKSKQKDNYKNMELLHNKNSKNQKSSQKEEQSLSINRLINSETNIEDSPLFQAIYAKNKNKIKKLLDNGENPNAKILDGITPLHLAINKKDEIIIEYLLKHKANPNSKTIVDGQTPVHLAAINCSNEKILKLLIKYGGLFDIKDNNNKTALDYIKEINDIQVYNNIKKLINANKNKKKKESRNEKCNPFKVINQNLDKNDIITDNNTIYNDSSYKNDSTHHKDFVDKKNECDDIKKDLLNAFEDSSNEKNDNFANNDKNYSLNKENVNPNSTIFSNLKKMQNYINCENYGQEDSSKSMQKEMNNYSWKNKEISNRRTKGRTNSTLSELIQINKENSSSFNEHNLTNIIKINNMPKIIFDNVLNLNNNLTIHKKSKSINNNLLIYRLSAKNRKSQKIKSKLKLANYSNTINYHTKIFEIDDNNKKKLENEQNDSLIINNNIINNKDSLINKKLFKKRRHIPYTQKNSFRGDSMKTNSIISNLSKINKKEDFDVSKIIDLNDNTSICSNNHSALKIGKKDNNINKGLSHENKDRKTINNNDYFYNKHPIYYFLKDINLLIYYDLFLENNIYDFNKLIIKLRNDLFSLSKEDFQKIGIIIPGHIYRIITKLEIDCGKIKKDISNYLLYQRNINNNIYSNSVDGIDDSGYYCVGCCEQKNIKNNLNNSKEDAKILELDNWLNKMGLLKYRNNFIFNGFDYVTYFILQMFSSIPIDEYIVKNELGINNENDADIILLQLNKEVKYILKKLRNKEKRIKNNYNIKGNEDYENEIILSSRSSKNDCQII